jgi:nucleoside-diphosphate-sugar epimerase
MVDISYIDNVAEAHVLAADVLGPQSTLCGRAYFIGQECPVNLWDFINTVVTRAGCRPVTRSISRKRAMQLAGLLEGVYAQLGLRREPPLTRMMVSQMSSSHWFDHGAATRDFSYKPRVDIEEGLRRTLPN